MSPVLTPQSTNNVLIGEPLSEEDYQVQGLLYGLPKAGKTYLLATAPKPMLILLTETGPALPTLKRAMKDLDIKNDEILVQRIVSMHDFEQTVDRLVGMARGSFPYASVCLDGLTDLQRIARRDIPDLSKHYHKDGKRYAPQDKLEQGEWDWMRNWTTRMLVELRRLPSHLWVTALVRTERDDRWMLPYVEPKGMAMLVASHFNLVGYVGVVSVMVEGQPKPVPVRVMQLEPGNLRDILPNVMESEDIKIAANPGGLLEPFLFIEQGKPVLTEIVERLRG